MYYIISHNDLDGYGSAYIVKRRLECLEVPSENITVINTDYSKELDLEKVMPNDIVFITDFSLKPDDMNKLTCRGVKDIIWIDHHKSALYYKQDYLYLENISGIQEVGMSATALAWIWFYAPDEIKKADIKTQEGWLMQDAPKWVNLVDAWDVWKLDSSFREEAEQLNTAVANILSYEIIEDLYDTMLLQNYLTKGKLYMTCMKEYSESYLKNYGFEITINVNYNKYKAIALNRGACGSKAFNELIDIYDVCIPFATDGEKVKVSMYSNKGYFDCSKVCRSLDGGGHQRSSRFYIRYYRSKFI